MKNLLFATLLILAGCATGSHIVTGKVRPAVSPDGVTIYSAMPTNAETIGIVNATYNNGHSQRGMDKCVAELKNQAGMIGANGVVLGTAQDSKPVPIFTQYGVIMAGGNATISGTAIFVP